MFITRYNTYLATDLRGDIIQKFYCDFYDATTARPAVIEDFFLKGYRVEKDEHNYVALIHNDKGYLSVESNLNINHTGHKGECEIFREVEPSSFPSEISEIPEADGIAKKIHQIGIYPENPGIYPEVYIKNRNNIVNSNQSYNFYFWSEGGYHDIEEFIKEVYGDEVLKYYQAIDISYAAARSDFFRYLCLYALGGVYLDLKSTIVCPLDQIIQPEDRFLVSFWHHNARVHPELDHIPYGGEYEQFYLISAKGHPLMKKVIHQVICDIKMYDPQVSGIGQYGTLRLAGPVIFSKIVHEYRKHYPKSVRAIHSISNGVSYSIFHNNAHHKIFSSGGKHYGDNVFPIVRKNILLP